MPNQQIHNLYIFLDEGGDFNFSEKGTRFFTLTSVTMMRPFNMANDLDELKYDFIEQGIEIESFHASEDKQIVRDRVFEIIQRNLDKIQIDTLIVEKRKTGPALRDPVKFYPRMLGYLLRYLLNRGFFGSLKIEDLSAVFVITDSIPLKKKRHAIEKAIKPILKEVIPNTRWKVAHHSSKSSMELQVADYCNWAIYRKYAGGDTRSYDLIRSAISSEFNIFEVGTTYYY